MSISECRTPSQPRGERQSRIGGWGSHFGQLEIAQRSRHLILSIKKYVTKNSHLKKRLLGSLGFVVIVVVFEVQDFTLPRRQEGWTGSSKPPPRAPYHNCVLPPLATRGQCTAAGLKKKISHMLVNIFLGSIRCNEKVRDFQIRHIHTHTGVLPNEYSRGSRLASSAACTRGHHSSLPNTALADRLWLGPGPEDSEEGHDGRPLAGTSRPQQYFMGTLVLKNKLVVT